MFSKRVVALVLIVVATLLFTQVVKATTIHNPPWSDNFHYSYGDGSYTRDAATIAESNQDNVGYDGDARLNYSANSVAYSMQNDAVWSIYAHGNRTSVLAYDGSNNSNLTRDMVLGYDISGLKVAAFYGCNTAQGPGSDHITNAAVSAGAGASIGFYATVYMSGGYTTGPAYTWSKYFWQSMAGGNIINSAAAYARDSFYQERGDYGGTDSYSTWGNGSQKITPAGYK